MNDKRLKLLNEVTCNKINTCYVTSCCYGMMIQVLYNLVDTFFIGKLDDPNQLAAANIATPIFMILMSLAGVVGTGAASYISRCLGEKITNKQIKLLQ